jgi:sec-independent protein translocase protein TatA
MIPRLGVWELALVLGILLVIFGPRKLPEIGRSLGKTINEFRKSNKEDLEPEALVEAVEETSSGKAYAVTAITRKTGS